MKKFLLFLALAVFAVSFFGTVACKKAPVPDVPTPEPTRIATPVGTVVILDDMEDGDNRTNSGNVDFDGGYWFTYDDLAAPNNGTSIVSPQSETAVKKFNYNGYTGVECPVPVATFSMSDPKLLDSAMCARISGTVTDNTSVPPGFQYGFVGYGFDLKTAIPGATPCVTPDTKQTADLVALGYTKLHFIAKNGPTVSGTKAWKVKLVSNANGFTDACDVPVKTFSVTDEWAAFDMDLSTFAQEGWCSSSGCGCFSTASFLAAMIGFQFQTNYRPGDVDILIDDVYLVK